MITSQCVTKGDGIIVTTVKGIVIRTPLTNIRVMGRATQGVRIINLKSGDKVSDLVRIPTDDAVEGIAEVDKELKKTGAADTQESLDV